jgi:hypothetical protein
MCGSIDPEEEGGAPIKNVRNTVRKKPRKDTYAVCRKVAEKKSKTHIWIRSADFVKRK